MSFVVILVLMYVSVMLGFFMVGETNRKDSIRVHDDTVRYRPSSTTNSERRTLPLESVVGLEVELFSFWGLVPTRRALLVTTSGDRIPTGLVQYSAGFYNLAPIFWKTVDKAADDLKVPRPAH